MQERKLSIKINIRKMQERKLSIKINIRKMQERKIKHKKKYKKICKKQKQTTIYTLKIQKKGAKYNN